MKVTFSYNHPVVHLLSTFWAPRTWDVPRLQNYCVLLHKNSTGNWRQRVFLLSDVMKGWDSLTLLHRKEKHGHLEH